MTRILLDTTFLVDVERGGVDVEGAIDDADDVAIAAITLAELLVGVELASSRHRTARQRYVDEIIETMPVVSYDHVVARSHAQLLAAVRRQGRPKGAHDLIIAATAHATDRTVVTADLDAFSDLPGVSSIGHR